MGVYKKVTYRKKKKKVRFTVKVAIFFTIAVITQVFCNIFLNSVSNALTMEIQDNEAKIQELKEQNLKLNSEIQTLQDRERVYYIAKDAGMEQNQDNVVSVVVEE